MRKIFIVGHRGAPSLAPENTISSFKKAIELGVDFIELDVRITKDNVLVIMHDKTIDRTTNGKGEISEIEFSKLRKLDAGSWFSCEFRGEKVPTLKEVFENFKNSVNYIVELKVTGIEKDVVNLIMNYNLINNVIIHSSNYDSIRKVKEIESSITTMTDVPLPNIENLIKAIANYANIVSIHKDKLERDFVRFCHKRGTLVNAWPINTLEELRKSIYSEVDFITTDFPQRIIKYLEKANNL